ncbi:MAG: queuosine precursor transporter [Candidatus Altiarchaeales archaeon]|nr:queuosine precursor transporter [Candidatus Altiarchaeales archaeon]MBD3416209.1 queuosine precursor transporter [Candidatus Altiarchaeales archaeon]
MGDKISSRKTSLLLGLFVMSLVLSNALGAKIAEFHVPDFVSKPLNVIFYPLIYIMRAFLASIGGREIPLNFFDTFHVSVGILTVPLMFLITDIVEEVYGMKKVKEFIFVGVSSMVVMIIITTVAVMLPSAERSVDPQSYNAIFKVTIRMSIASICAFVLAQVHDMWSFEFWKSKTRGKHLWLRNNLSTMVSQLIDSTVFMFVAFYKSAPMWDAVFIISLIIPYWIFKILFAILDTPLAYAGVRWVREG